MRFLDQPPRFLFFTGKGGVGKTSMAAATALQLAGRGRRVLLVSTDPASNVGQVLQASIGHRITSIPSVPGLSALEIDPSAAAQAYRDRIVGPVRGVLPETVVAGIEEQLSGACTTEIAAFDEFTALLSDTEQTAHFDHVVFDTAPTGHTIRLLSLPGAWDGFLAAGKGNASCLGPLAGLDKQRDQYRAAVAALSDPDRTRLVLVSRAQPSALAEVARTQAELAAIGFMEQYLIINGMMPEREVAGDRLARAIHSREQAALLAIPPALARLPQDRLPLKPASLVGVEPLRRLFSDDGTIDAEDPAEYCAEPLPSLSSLLDGLADQGHGLVMLMGKGGVGKTTLAATIAVDLARRGCPVHLSTSDPAAHLTATLRESLEHLELSRIDPLAETERYRQRVLETQGAKLDERGRALLEEDLLSPCTEEIAVFQAFSRIIREADEKFVVMDTAPTGHTLLLLDATGAYHREVMRNSGNDGPQPMTPLIRLRDAQHTRVLVVTHAETTPVLEAAGLQDELLRAGIEPWAWIINSSLAAATPHSTLLRRRARNEWREIQAIASDHARRYAIVPLLENEPVGVDELLAMAKPPDKAADVAKRPTGPVHPPN